MECNLCNSTGFKLIWNETRFESNNILECQNCDLVFLEQNKTKADIEDFYTNDYRKVKTLPALSAEERYVHPVTVQDCEDRIAWLKPNLRERFVSLKGKRVLEIGSATGRFLDTLQSEGAYASGLELTTSFVDHSIEKGFDMYSKPLEALNFDNKFDIIVTFHALEHMFDAKQIINTVHKALKPGGIFAGEVPNQNDWRLKIFDSTIAKNFHYDPNHYYYFSPDTLRQYLNNCGFADITLETVERYNSLVQLRRILNGEYEDSNKDTLSKDIFVQPKQDLRVKSSSSEIELMFNKSFEHGINHNLMGNCLRWIATKA